MADYAEPDDVANRWRPLSTAEQAQAAVLIGDATRMIRRRFPQTDARIDSRDLAAEDVASIVAYMVKRVMMVGGREGVTQTSDTAGPFSTSAQYTNPQGNLYLSKDDIAVLTPSTQARAFMLDLSPGH